MIIAISGKIGSGKDTVGNIITNIIADYEIHGQIIQSSDMYKYPSHPDYCNGWEIKKFAGKLKQIVSILTGIPVEDLEKQEVKDSLLGKEWGSYGNPLLRTQDTPFTIPTVRWLLQNVGTNAMRNVIHSDIWVNALFSDYKEHVNHDFIPPQNEGYPNWVITDCRFPNELKAVKDRGGISIKVTRKSVELYDKTTGIYTYPNYKPHESETALDNATFDWILPNDGTIEELIVIVKQTLITEKII